MDINLTEQIGPYASAARVTNTFTTKQDVSPSPVPVIPGSKLRPGSSLKLYAAGHVSTTGSPTLILGFWYGTRALTITGDVAIMASASTVTGAASWPWEMEWEGICTVAGASGQLLGQGKVRIGSSLTAYSAEIAIPGTAGARTVTGFDTTIERAIGVSATFSASSASNEVGVNKLRLMIFN